MKLLVNDILFNTYFASQSAAVQAGQDYFRGKGKESYSFDVIGCGEERREGKRRDWKYPYYVLADKKGNPLPV